MQGQPWEKRERGAGSALGEEGERRAKRERERDEKWGPRKHGGKRAGGRRSQGRSGNGSASTGGPQRGMSTHAAPHDSGSFLSILFSSRVERERKGERERGRETEIE